MDLKKRLLPSLSLYVVLFTATCSLDASRVILVELDAPWRSPDGQLAVTSDGLLCQSTETGQFRPLKTTRPIKTDVSPRAQLIRLSSVHRKGAAQDLRHLTAKSCELAIQRGLLVVEGTQDGAAAALQGQSTRLLPEQWFNALRKMSGAGILPAADALYQRNYVSGV